MLLVGIEMEMSFQCCAKLNLGIIRGKLRRIAPAFFMKSEITTLPLCMALPAPQVWSSSIWQVSFQ